MPSPIQEVRPGDKITAAWANRVSKEACRLNPNGFNVTSGGAYLPKRTDWTRPPFIPPTKTPFQVYQCPADPANPTDADWRTFIVHAGIVNSAYHPATDDSSQPVAPATTTVATLIQPPAGTDLYKVWLSVAIDTSDGTPQNSTWTINSSATGWSVANGDASSFPDQPNAAVGLAPNFYYQLIAEITVGSGTPGDQTYQQVTIYQYAFSNFVVQPFITGATVSSAQGGCMPNIIITSWPQ